MVYGRILYNNIKEYTPKWFPTIPYSQTTKPIFSTYPLNQDAALKSSPQWTPTPLPSSGGDSSAESSNKMHGPIKSSSSHSPSPCTTPSTLPLSPCISPTTPIAHMRLRSPRKEHIRRNSRKLKTQLQNEAWSQIHIHVISIYFDSRFTFNSNFQISQLTIILLYHSHLYTAIHFWRA